MLLLSKKENSMKNAYITIGSFFGDEGKGKITDILCSKNSSTVNVRFNGGAQASHTVVTTDGKRHAFRHFGSGTFANIPTYLSENFIVNVYAFSEERRNLINQFEISSNVYVNPNCIVTTLWDMYINQAIETLRGNDRHGSCGMGINETVQRSKYEEYRITVMDLLYTEKLRKKLQKIQDEYVPQRLKNEYHISIEDLSKKYKDLLKNEENIDMTIFYVQEFLENVQIMGDYILKRFDNIVFEGAQGLMLDQGCKKFLPNVTTSNTGIKNVMDILKNLDFKGNLEIYYISRCYVTRHGRGLLPTEVKGKPYKKIVDMTNIPNEFQESLRFGNLDIDLLVYGINRDLQNLSFSAEINIVFTCFDQLDDFDVKYVLNEKEEKVSKKQFLSKVGDILKKNITNLGNIYVSEGEKRGKLIKLNNKNCLKD